MSIVRTAVRNSQSCKVVGLHCYGLFEFTALKY